MKPASMDEKGRKTDMPAEMGHREKSKNTWDK